MNRDAIKKTAVCRFDDKEKLYIVESPLLDICSGIAEAEEEAWEIFDDLLQVMYVEYLEGRQVGQYAKRGRPAKNRVSLNCQVKPDTLENVKVLASKLDISQGECIDYIYAACMASGLVHERVSPRASTPAKKDARTEPTVATKSAAKKISQKTTRSISKRYK